MSVCARPREDSTASRRAQGAALGIGLFLFVLATPGGSSRRASCENPFEVSAVANWTRDVGCAEAPRGPTLRGPARILFGQGLELNQANLAALQVLPGIGPVRAADIVRARQRRPFRSVEDLRAIHGIGPKTVERLAGWVSVEDDDG